MTAVPTADPTRARTARRDLAIAVALMALVASLLATTPTPAGATDSPPVGFAQDASGVSRIDGGGDVRQTAIDVCQVVRPDPDSAARVLVSRDDAFADALAGSALLNFDSCILYTQGGADAALDPRARTEIDRVLTDGGEIGLLGGTDAVSSLVESELTDAGYAVDRYAGASRFETAVAIAQRAAIQQDTAPFRDVILANGEDWPDAVTSGAYAAVFGTPVVLTQHDRLHAETERFLSAQGFDQTWVVGGEGVIAEAVAQQTANPVRVAGSNRMGTASAVAEQMWQGLATGEDVVFANLEHPQGWTLALAAAPLSVHLGAPQLGVRTDSVPPETQSYLEDRTLRSATLMGGSGFISVEVEEQVAATVHAAPVSGPTGPVTPFAYTDAGEAVRYVDANGQDVQLMPGDVIYPPTWSDDGTQLAVVVGDGTESVADGGYTGELVIATVDSSGALLNSTTVTQDAYGEPLRARRPVWSPDGQRIAFLQTRFLASGQRYRELATYDVDTATVDNHPATFCAGPGPQAWSPDGEELIGACLFDDTYELVHVDVAGGGTLTRLGAQGLDPSWSPDGTQIVYGRTSDEVVVQPIANGSLQGSATVLDQIRWACLSWRNPDDLFVCGVPGETGQPPTEDGGVFTYDVTVGPGSRQRVATPPNAARGAVESAAGEIGIWTSHPAGTGDVIVYDASGTELFHHDDRAYGPAFRPTGGP